MHVACPVEVRAQSRLPSRTLMRSFLMQAATIMPHISSLTRLLRGSLRGLVFRRSLDVVDDKKFAGPLGWL
jgi:hypothetical protein